MCLYKCINTTLMQHVVINDNAFGTCLAPKAKETPHSFDMISHSIDFKILQSFMVQKNIWKLYNFLCIIISNFL